ncbi:MAG: aspartate--tRNA ligase [Planctomycetota bacterium]
MYRTHTCGEARLEFQGEQWTLAGWVDSVRDHGGVLFVDLRDRYGRTQVVLHPENLGEQYSLAQKLRDEQVIQVTGALGERPGGMQNPSLSTGEVELVARDLQVLADCPPLPFTLSKGAAEPSEELRFRYRYLDMRRDAVRERFEYRSRMLFHMRRFLFEEGFVELETPFLVKSTPEGARDFLVPSRGLPGQFYALPQSPQLFKQIFMVAGMDRYMQIVRCFRDEDLRADRQQEFTQLDLEMAFVEQSDVLELVERLMQYLMRELKGVELAPIPRLSYEEAMERYGTDTPDLRYGLELTDLSQLARDMEFRVFRSAVEKGGRVKGIRVPGGGHFTRKEIEELEKGLRDQGASGLAWVKLGKEGWVGPLARFLSGEVEVRFRELFRAQPGDLLLMVADEKAAVVHASLARLRSLVAEREGYASKEELSYLWVTDFPLLEHDPEADRLKACHHPFTAPHPEDVKRLETEPLKVRAVAHDLVLNGTEIAGGSIRIHDPGVQERVFRAIGISEQEAKEKFHFLLEALRYGAPPHGGIAFGLDRLVMHFLGLDSIREVIAFPKTQRGTCPLTGAPTQVAPEQLKELGLIAQVGDKETQVGRGSESRG